MRVNGVECSYQETTKMEKSRFQSIVFALFDATLSMVRNGVVVLPLDLDKNAKKTFYKHITIQNCDRRVAFERYRYDDFMSMKDVFLECLPNKRNRELLNMSLKKIVYLKNHHVNHKSRIKFIFNKNIVASCELHERQCLIKDVLFFERIINHNNDRFVKQLPKALLYRKRTEKLMAKKTKVPEKAVYHENRDVVLLDK